MDLERFLKLNGFWYRIIEKTETIHTADAAEATGIELRRITKNLISKTNEGEFVILIVPGDKRVDLEAAAKALRVQHVQLVPFDQAEEISGYPPGATPSIGHRTRMRTVFDESILKHDTVYCGGGSRNKLLELKTADILRFANPLIANITRD